MTVVTVLVLHDESMLQTKGHMPEEKEVSWHSLFSFPDLHLFLLGIKNSLNLLAKSVCREKSCMQFPFDDFRCRCSFSSYSLFVCCACFSYSFTSRGTSNAGDFQCKDTGSDTICHSLLLLIFAAVKCGLWSSARTQTPHASFS